MPYVNIKYQLTLDATVMVKHLKFHGQEVTPVNTSGDDSFPDIKVFIAGELSIDLLMEQGVGQWKIEVWVIEINSSGMQINDWRPLNANGTSAFTNDVSVQNSLLGDYTL